MKLHRFYVASAIELNNKIWVSDADLLHQWTRVLRFRPGQQVILFNDSKEEKLYVVDRIEAKSVHLNLVTEMVARTPKNNIYLCFSLLKKDKNNWILQKATELGVRHFVPLITSRTEKTGFDVERANKIVIEAAEQCGRTDIPLVREPIGLPAALRELKDNCELLIAEQGSSLSSLNVDSARPLAVFVGPEGGWTDDEKQLFIDNEISHLPLGEFTLRAETACVTAASVLSAI